MSEADPYQTKATAQNILSAITMAGVLCGLLIGCLCVKVPDNRALAEGSYAIQDSIHVATTLRGTHIVTGTQTDIVLVLDRSGSMNWLIDSTTSDSKIAALRDAAGEFISIVDDETDGLSNGIIANENRVGVVSFSDTVQIGSELTTSVQSIRAAVEHIEAHGSTAIGKGIATAQTLLTDESRKRIMIVFTDGQENNNSDPDAQASAAKKAGTIIFTIGFGLDVDYDKLREWASGNEDEKEQYAYMVYTYDELRHIFGLIGARMIEPAATDIRLVEKVTDGFVILAPSVRGDPGSNNYITITDRVTPDRNMITWTPGTLNTGAMTLTYRVEAVGRADTKLVDLHTSITYSKGSCSDISSVWLQDKIRTLIEIQSERRCDTD